MVFNPIQCADGIQSRLQFRFSLSLWSLSGNVYDVISLPCIGFALHYLGLHCSGWFGCVIIRPICDCECAYDATFCRP